MVSSVKDSLGHRPLLCKLMESRVWKRANGKEVGRLITLEVAGRTLFDVSYANINLPVRVVGAPARCWFDMLAIHAEPTTDFSYYLGPARTSERVWFGLIEVNGRVVSAANDFGHLVEVFDGELKVICENPIHQVFFKRSSWIRAFGKLGLCKLELG